MEQEFLKRYEQSILSYKKGVEVAERYLGARHAICITLNNSLVAAKKLAAAAAMKTGGGGAGGHGHGGAVVKKKPAAAGTGMKKKSVEKEIQLGAPAPAGRPPPGSHK